MVGEAMPAKAFFSTRGPQSPMTAFVGVVVTFLKASVEWLSSQMCGATPVNP